MYIVGAPRARFGNKTHASIRMSFIRSEQPVLAADYDDFVTIVAIYLNRSRKLMTSNCSDSILSRIASKTPAPGFHPGSLIVSGR